MQIKAPRGTKDILPLEIEKWYFVEDLFRKITKQYNFNEIRTPTFEFTDLFERGVGNTSDIVSKEMYTFLDKGGRSITLKAEGTAPVVRSFIENCLYSGPLPVRLSYVTPVFRYEKPQAGRLREHHQLGIECFGSAMPSADAEVISLAHNLLKQAGITGVELRLNSIGCPDCRPAYNNLLSRFLSQPALTLCSDCISRRDKNPLRVLDCKNPACRKEFKNIPLITDSLCMECSDHFEQVKKLLSVLNISYTIDPGLVRGLDYYTRTAFEFVSNALGAVATVCGGGRYDKLVEELGAKSMPAVGFGMGIERFILLMDACGAWKNINSNQLDLMLVSAPGIETADLVKTADHLRNSGLSVSFDYMNRSFKAQMKYLNKCNARFFMVLGDDELKQNLFTVKSLDKSLDKSLENKLEKTLSLEEISTYIKA
jgi:histidyl-tRNA synthetase